MRKDKEWLKAEVLGLRNNGNGETNQTAIEREIGRLQKWAWNNCVDRVYELINQLDEPEVVSQKWIDNNSINASHDGITDEYVHVDDLENLLVPKQELPVIPKLVADYIQSSKDMDRTLFSAMKYVSEENQNEVGDWLWDGLGDNSFQLFARAWLDGFTVEKEQKYYVLSKDRKTILLGRCASGISPYAMPVTEKEEGDMFTEQEIKDYDERYWPFAVPVEVAE